MAERRQRRYFITNWNSSSLPVVQRSIVAVRNLALRLVRRDTCCGHEGEPGC
ncbi:MAG: hypothetical protein KGN00_11000 [Chloroflexota bacterium]|nr:hypothetical protein [Chloroflexota bacterium]MDE3194204.1 hypothetical protein [Chloroflexota bacterium]